MWGRGAFRPTNRCQSELQSLSCVSAVNYLSTTLVKVGAARPFVLWTYRHRLCLGALCDAGSQPTEGRSSLTLTYGKCISLPHIPPSLSSNEAGLLCLPLDDSITCLVCFWWSTMDNNKSITSRSARRQQVWLKIKRLLIKSNPALRHQ